MKKQLATFSFHAAAEVCVRLASFGGQTGVANTDQGGFFGDLAEELAHNDLITCSIALRRLAEFSEFNKFARNLKLKTVGPVQVSPSRWKIKHIGQTVVLWEFLNVVLHSNIFEVISDDFQIKLFARKWKESPFELLEDAKYKSEFHPTVFLGSAHVKPFMVEIREFTRVTMKFLDHVSEKLADDDVYVGNSSVGR